MSSANNNYDNYVNVCVDDKIYSLVEHLVIKTEKLMNKLVVIDRVFLSKNDSDELDELISYVDAYKSEAQYRIGNTSLLLALRDEINIGLTVLVDEFLNKIKK
jgi:hypothetical protein